MMHLKKRKASVKLVQNSLGLKTRSDYSKPVRIRQRQAGNEARYACALVINGHLTTDYVERVDCINGFIHLEHRMIML